MGRDVLFDFSAGGGSDLEFLIGDLTLEPSAMHEVGDRTVLPMPRTEGVNAGLLTLEDVAISPDGPNPLWAYKITVRDTISKKAYSTIVGVPAGTGPITFKLLPKFQMPPNPGLGPTVQWLVEDFLAKSETITNAVAQAIAADPRIGQIESKNTQQDDRLDVLDANQAIKSVRFENGQWVWDIANPTHYVLIAHDGKPTVRATQWPQPSPTTPEFTW